MPSPAQRMTMVKRVKDSVMSRSMRRRRPSAKYGSEEFGRLSQKWLGEHGRLVGRLLIVVTGRAPEDGALPEADEGARDSVVVVGVGVDESA